MKKRILTDEEKARIEAKREAFRELCKKVGAMSDTERADLSEKLGAILSCEGRELSPRNAMLLMMQRPNVSVVGGFRQWKKQGRHVMKGERGLSILVPTAKAESAAVEETGEGGGRVFFITGTVFDISQTKEAGADVSGVSDEAEDEEGAPASSAVQAAPVLALPAPIRDEAVWGQNSYPFKTAEEMRTVPVKTIWDSPDGSGGPLLICAPPRPSNVVEAVFTLEGGRE